jgi:squalene-hopene/tetraprenyl-beta-curcumene cyclase
LAAIAPGQYASQIDRAAQWLKQCQNLDGGWGETCASYNNPALKGQGESTASQTAWAVIGLLAAGGMAQPALRSAIERGITYLIKTQQPDGTWDEAYFTGTGFPGHFYLKYHLYQQHFPLTALGRYRSCLAAG